ncbi:MAG TPA: MBL fold metallo-hydrolase [Acidimicrobiales bacterium]
MIEVVVLGSGTPRADPGRAGSALAVVADRDWLLVDCGRAATQRAIDAGLDLTALAAVALTHHHSDHVSDLATLATARWVAGATTPLAVVAPAGPTARFASHCLDAFEDQCFYGQSTDAAGPRPQVAVQAFEPAGAVTTVHDAGAWRLSAVLVDHPPVAPSVGYLVETGGARVAVSGDTAVGDGMRALARDVDVLVHETLHPALVSDELLAWNAGADAVGALAAATSPATLVLTHLLPAPVTPDHERSYLAEVRRAGFDGPTVVARDLVRIPVEPRRSA